MEQAGLIKAKVTQAPSPGRLRPVSFIFQDITPAGHDFIAALKNNSFGARLKKQAAEKAVPVTLDVLVQIAKAKVKNAFFLGDGGPDKSD